MLMTPIIRSQRSAGFTFTGFMRKEVGLPLEFILRPRVSRGPGAGMVPALDQAVRWMCRSSVARMRRTARGTS